MNEEKSKCTKRQCLWIGKDSEKTKKPLQWAGIEGSVLCCPKCGNDEFYVISKDKQSTEKLAQDIAPDDFIKPKEKSRHWQKVSKIEGDGKQFFVTLENGCQFFYEWNDKIKVADFPESVNQ